MTSAPNTMSYVAIGSNIAPESSIRRCLDLLEHLPETRLCLESSWYRTSPWGVEEQADFINLAVGLETALSPHALLAATQEIERKLDRVREIKNGPRTIDLDILLFGELRLDEGGLRIPHPGLVIRDFMLIPLIEIAPDARHPELGLPVRSLMDRIRFRQILEKLPPRPNSSD